MTHKKKAILMLICDILLILCIAFMLSACVMRDQVVEEHLSGSELRQMMNEAKYSPGAADIHAADHPSFAWLFDGSYVTYITD